MRNKKFYYLIFLIIFISHPAQADSKGQSQLEKEMNQENWIKYKNNHGWEISHPPCWEVVTSESGDIRDAQFISIQPKTNCPVEFLKDFGMDIVVPKAIKLSSPRSRVQPMTESKASSKEPFEYVKTQLRPNPTEGYICFGNNGGSKVLDWVLHSTCNNKNLHYSMMAPIPKEKIDLPLSQQKLPKVLEKMTESFVCTKP